MTTLVERLRAVGRADLAPDLIKRAARVDADELVHVLHAIDMITSEVEPARTNLVPTIREIGERWTRGDLAREFPDHIKMKDSPSHDAGRLDLYVYPLVGDVSIDRFSATIRPSEHRISTPTHNMTAVNVAKVRAERRTVPSWSRHTWWFSGVFHVLSSSLTRASFRR